LLSTYDLGRQPFGLASPAAWLHDAGWQVRCQDLAIEPLDLAAAASAQLIALHLPMHTATRLAAELVPRLREMNPGAHLCCYGLYAPLNQAHLRSLGVQTILGGEFEQDLAALAARLAGGETPSPDDMAPVNLARQTFRPPRRDGLPALEHYAQLHMAHDDRRLVGTTEASRGCKHRCRHCPVVPVYDGLFRLVDQEVVLADVRWQVRAGARHITFGDPDFFNAPSHSMRLIERLHREHPHHTFDVTIKVQHLLEHRAQLPALQEGGCILVTTAVESLDDAVLHRLQKGHTREDVLLAADLLRAAGIALNATFIPFTPWTTLDDYRDLLRTLHEQDLVEHVAPIQLAIRLLITAGSRLLEMEEIRALAGPLDVKGLVHPWKHPDPAMDRLAEDVLVLVTECDRQGLSRRETFHRICRRAGDLPEMASSQEVPAAATVPFLTEPWYC
jgi:radical SAM superfamily enzyme YgiQ (UPF0313 family)